MASTRFHISADETEKPCDKCGAPPSWVESNDLPWYERLQYQIISHNLSPRMWPMGYILASPYSPLYLEQEIPKRNWRDAFEDLIALDSHGDMISAERRKQEEEVAARLYVESVHYRVSHVNNALKRDRKHLSLLHRWRSYVGSQKGPGSKDLIDHIDTKAIPFSEEHSRNLVKDGEAMIARLKEDQTKNLPASKYKLKTQWIASLVTSGAVPGWEATLFDSFEGPGISIGKLDPDANDGSIITEFELTQQFEQGVLMTTGSPQWSTLNDPYPSMLQILNLDTETDYHPPFQIPPLGSFIDRQFARVERSRLSSGVLSTKAIFTNHFTDGSTEVTEIVDDPSRVLQEQQRLYHSFRSRYQALEVAIFENDYRMMEEPLKEQEELDGEEFE